MPTGKPMHHISKRKRVHQKLEKYPHTDPKKRFIDKLIFAAALVGPMMTAPQSYNVWFLRSFEGVSIYTWLAMTVTSSIWFYYGFVHRDRAIMFSSSLWIFMNTSIWGGILIFG
jgi:uncharacterized protein with PQ loop repeat